jgi:hypothetical protein
MESTISLPAHFIISLNAFYVIIILYCKTQAKTVNESKPGQTGLALNEK